MTGQDITACVLAGGNSLRMGTDKALLVLDGIPLIEHVARTLQKMFASVIVIADHTEAYQFLGVPVLPDRFKKCGPLGGIHAGFVHTNARSLFVLACDTPFISRALIQHIVASSSNAHVTVPMMDGRTHPLCALYSHQCFSTLEQSLQSGYYSIQRFLEQVHTLTLPISSHLPFYHPSLLHNINNQSELLLARESMAKRITA